MIDQLWAYVGKRLPLTTNVRRFVCRGNGQIWRRLPHICKRCAGITFQMMS
jgi:hypothetical protein